MSSRRQEGGWVFEAKYTFVKCVLSGVLLLISPNIYHKPLSDGQE